MLDGAAIKKQMSWDVDNPVSLLKKNGAVRKTSLTDLYGLQVEEMHHADSEVGLTHEAK